jgi:anhydro-N-acetylmuramic acid kinase
MHAVHVTEVAWPPELRTLILSVLPPAPSDAATWCRLDTQVGQFFASAATAAIADVRDAGWTGRVDLVVSHGQTLFHWVEGDRARGTLQVGNGSWIARATGLPVLSDLRSADIAAGGHGAPLAPTFDALWLAGHDGPQVTVNIGGISNITVVSPDGVVEGRDVGPGNCLIDLAVATLTDGSFGYDVDGRIASSGTVRRDLLDSLVADPAVAPSVRSTGREVFHSGFIEHHRAALAGPAVTGPDLIATLTEFTAVVIADAVRHTGADRLVVAGGGARNPVLLARIAAHLNGMHVLTSDDLGVPAGAKESFLFALIGWLSANRLPGTAPGPEGRSSTGASRPVVLGSWTLP